MSNPTAVPSQMPMPEAVPRILILETDAAIAQNVSQDLQEVGYKTTVLSDPKEALRQALSQPPAMVIVDRGLDNEAALGVCEQLRQQGQRLPIVLMMNRDGVDDRVICLEVGADDYFIKQPYRTDELIKLVQFYLKTEVTTQEQLRFGDLLLDLGTRQVLRSGKAIDLTMKEFELLKYMMEHPREVLSREQILENVWGFDYVGESNVIEVYIRYLRLKIEDEGGKRLIQTVRGIGYVLREN